jgi:K+-sensing histidine kinase KdpD
MGFGRRQSGRDQDGHSLPGIGEPARSDFPFGWPCASILHDLRNPLGTICAGAELLMDLDSTSTQVKRLAGNMYHAACRTRQLLADLASIAHNNIPTAEICDIREVITAAWEAALASVGIHSIQILLNVPAGIDLPLALAY